MPTFHVENFGCRATQADGSAIERQFARHGLERASSADANVVVLNTCTVTNSADQDARAAIRRVRRENPQARIVVTGCYAQRAPEEIAKLPGVACVIGNSHKHQLADLVLNNAVPGPQGFVPLRSLRLNVKRTPAEDERPTNDRRPLYVSDIFAHTELLAAPVIDCSAEGRTRPNLKVQDGCDNRCSFCVIPSVRGHSRSLPEEQVIAEINALVSAGYRELVISGINLGRWGRDLIGLKPQDSSEFEATANAGRDLGLLASDVGLAQERKDLSSRSPKAQARSLVSLIRTILEHTCLEKLRISSVEPMDWTDDLIALVASSSRIAKHAHVPLQSGSDAVLRRMHRKYRPWHYREKIEKIHSAMPSAAIGADVMVGFPGETESEFEATRHLIAELPFTYLHVFTYSARPGTPAASMANQVPAHIARERSRILRDLGAEKKSNFMHSFVGSELQAITLNQVEGDAERQGTAALTDNYQKLLLRERHAANRWITAQIEGAEGGALIGRAV